MCACARARARVCVCIIRTHPRLVLRTPPVVFAWRNPGRVCKQGRRADVILTVPERERRERGGRGGERETEREKGRQGDRETDSQTVRQSDRVLCLSLDTCSVYYICNTYIDIYIQTTHTNIAYYTEQVRVCAPVGVSRVVVTAGSNLGRHGDQGERQRDTETESGTRAHPHTHTGARAHTHTPTHTHPQGGRERETWVTAGISSDCMTILG